MMKSNENNERKNKRLINTKEKQAGRLAARRVEGKKRTVGDQVMTLLSVSPLCAAEGGG